MQTIFDILNTAQKIIVIQAENPDGDSIGSAVALEEILGDMGKDVSLYCPVDIPRYLRYIKGWDRVTNEFDTKADMAIIVDTASSVLLSKVLAIPAANNFLNTKPVLVLDHHTTATDLEFPHELVSQSVVATGELIFNLATENNWPINAQAAEDMLIAIMSDSLGLTTPNVTPETFAVAGKLTELGAKNYEIEERRREFIKKSPEILAYKGKLIERVEYFLDGALAVVHVPFEEIEQYSDQYNPGALIGDELRLVEGVQVNAVIKTYPDGKLTARLRSNAPISEAIAGFFGGGGHKYAAGFRIYEGYDQTLKELIDATDKALKENNG